MLTITKIVYIPQKSTYSFQLIGLSSVILKYIGPSDCSIVSTVSSSSSFSSSFSSSSILRWFCCSSLISKNIQINRSFVWLTLLKVVSNGDDIHSQFETDIYLFSWRLPHSKATTIIPFATMSAGITLHGLSSLHNIELTKKNSTIILTVWIYRIIWK